MKSRSRLACISGRLSCIIVVVSCSIVVRTNAATFHGLGMLPGGNDSFTTALSSDGKVAVGNAAMPIRDTFTYTSFRWTEASGMQSLGYSGFGPNKEDEANGVSADGSFIAGMLDTGDTYLWSQSSGLQPLPTPSVNGSSWIVAWGLPVGISSNGQTIVSTSIYPSFPPGSAICWIGTNNYPIPVIDGQPYDNSAVAVSDDGLVVTGLTATNGGGCAYRWTAASGVELLTDLSGSYTYSEADAMSRDGSIIVGFAYGFLGNSAEQWFRWTAETGAVGIGNPHDGDRDRPYGVSNDGNTIVGGTGGNSDFVNADTNDALIWRPRWGVRLLQDVLTNDYQLDLTGWHLTSARAVSTNGTVIVGNGFNPSGQREAWIATIDLTATVPLPQLTIRIDSANCVLIWPTNAAGFVLEQATDGTLTNWTSVPVSPAVVGTRFVATNAIATNNGYFRLRN